MNERMYFTMFKNEPDILTVPDLTRLLRMGKNTVYALIKSGNISSIKQGKKIIVPKTCLVDYLANEENYQIVSPNVPKNDEKGWTSAKNCGIVGVARDKKGNTLKKGA